jgi:hypothetical protein
MLGLARPAPGGAGSQLKTWLAQAGWTPVDPPIFRTPSGVVNFRYLSRAVAVAWLQRAWAYIHLRADRHAKDVESQRMLSTHVPLLQALRAAAVTPGYWSAAVGFTPQLFEPGPDKMRCLCGSPSASRMHFLWHCLCVPAIVPSASVHMPPISRFLLVPLISPPRAPLFAADIWSHPAFPQLVACLRALPAGCCTLAASDGSAHCTRMRATAALAIRLPVDGSIASWAFPVPEQDQSAFAAEAWALYFLFEAAALVHRALWTCVDNLAALDMVRAAQRGLIPVQNSSLVRSSR